MLEVSHPYYRGIEIALLTDTLEPTAITLTQTQLYPDQLPNDAQLPGVRYALLGDRPHQRLKSGESVTADVQIDVYALRGDSAAAWMIDAHVRRVLDRQNLTVEGFNAVQCLCTSRGVPFKEPGFYRITSKYRLFGSAA